MTDRARLAMDPTPVYNATNPVHVAHAIDADERFLQERLFSLRETLRAYTGRRVLWEMLSACGIYRSIFSSDPLEMAKRAGQQQLGHQLQADLLAADASLYDQMTREARARAKQDAAVTKAVLARPADDDEGVDA